LGLLDQNSWAFVNDIDNNPDTDARDYDIVMYIFALYETFVTFTTVGYGDYTGVNSREYLVTMCYQFIGFCFNAILISTMVDLFGADVSFSDLLEVRLGELDLWMKRIEKSYKPYYLHPRMGRQI